MPLPASRAAAWATPFVLATFCASCGGSCSGATAGTADAGADAAPAAELPPGVKACGNKDATPTQVATEFLKASMARDVDGMLACFKPKHRDTMAQRSSLLVELTVLKYSLGEEKIEGDTATVAADVERYDGHGKVEYKHDPIRLDRVDGAWYFR